MANKFKGTAKDILVGLADMGQLLVTGSSSTYGIANWKYTWPKDKEIEHRKEMKKKHKRALWQLQKSRLVLLSEKNNGTYVIKLTEKGKQKVKEIHLANLQIEIPKKWDGIWRIVIFDIPKEKDGGRDALRGKLKELNFYQLQKSVWILPHPCQKEIEFIVELFHLYPYIHIIEAQKIQNDVKARKHFHLL